MNDSKRRSTRAQRDGWVIALAGLAGLAAALAPVPLTGNAAVDAVERALAAAVVTAIGSHSRRWVWMVAGAALAASARGPGLVLALAGLAILAAAAVPNHRPRVVGAVGVGLLSNAPLWSSDTIGLAPVLVVVGFAALVAGGLPHLRRNARSRVRLSLALAGGAAALALIGLAAAWTSAQGAVTRGTSQATSALDAARAGDRDRALGLIEQARESFADAEAKVGGPLTLPARLLPGVAQHVEAVSTAVEVGNRVASAGGDVVATADYQDIRYDGRLDLGLIRSLLGPTEAADAVLESSIDELDEARRPWLAPPLRDRLEDFADTLYEARRSTDLAADVLAVAPGLLGGDGPRTYLVAFLTPAELRGGGGFLGSYAELRSVDGDIELTRSGPIRELVTAAPAGTRTLTGPADYLTRYGHLRPQDFVQDAPYSPDFPTNAEVIAQLYAQSGGSPVDGVIGVDPTGLAALLELTGPVPVDGLDAPLSAADAVQVLTIDQYLMFSDDASQERVLDQALRRTFEALTEGELPGPEELGAALGPAAKAGHLRMWTSDADEQKVMERIGADGALSIPPGADGFAIAQQNTANNKIDAYLQRDVTYRATVDPSTGELTAKLRIVLHNEVPSVDLPRVVVGNSRGAPVGTNVAWLSVFTPSVVAGASVDGEPVTLSPSREAGLNAWDLPIFQVPPGGSVTIELDLIGAVDLTDGYRLVLPAMPVANPDRVSATVEVDGRAVVALAERVSADGPLDFEVEAS